MSTNGIKREATNRGAAALTRVLAMSLLVAPAMSWPEEPATGESQLDEIVITAQKRAENLQNVPIVVTAVTAQQLQSAGVEDTASLPTLVSGLSIGYTASNFSPHIRGVGTTAYGIGIESPVGLYVDGVYYGSQLMGLSNLVDVSQVSVLKGPQGTLFGRNATGGVIQLTTRDPESDFGAEVRTELDNYLTSRSNIYLTDGISDALKANLSLSYATQGNGWGRNIYDGSDNHKLNHEFSGRSKFVLTPASGTSIRFNFDYTDRSDSMGNYSPAPGTIGRAPGYQFTDNPYDSDSSLNSLARLKSGGGSIDISQDLGFADLESISAYRQYDFHTQFDVSLSPTPELYQYITFSGNQASEEIHLVSHANPLFNWVGGLYFFHSRDEEFVDGHNFDVVAAPFTTSRNIETGVSGTDSPAAFGQTTVQVLPETHLTLGLRYTQERRTLVGAISGGSFGLFGDPTINLNYADFFPPVNYRATYHKLTYRVALDHNFTPDVLGYVSYNTGFKSGGFNGFNPSSGNPAYNPETVRSYEAGFKSELLDRRLRVNAAAFYNKYSDIQIIQFIAIPYLSNAAGAQTFGIDLDTEARITEDLRLTGGLEFLNSKFVGNSNGTVTAYIPDSGGMVASTTGSIRGNQLPFAPPLTANIGLTYSKAVGEGRVEFNVTNAYSAGYYLAEANFVSQRAYDYLNTMVTWNVDRWSVSFWGRNLLDKEVASFLTNGQLGYTRDFSNPPRTYGFRLVKRFGN